MKRMVLGWEQNQVEKDYCKGKRASFPIAVDSSYHQSRHPAMYTRQWLFLVRLPFV